MAPFGPAKLTTPCVQIAGIRTAAELRILVAHGVDYLGFPLRLPVHTPDLSESATADLIRAHRVQAQAVCITYETDPDGVAQLCRFLDVATVQLHGAFSPEALRTLRRTAPELTILKSLVLGREPLETIFQALPAMEPWVDGFLTDTFDPDSGASGATGRTHDWETSRAIVRATVRPVILAGGLTPANVAAAIATVRPAGVDAHTGVENSQGDKDPDRVQAFIQEAHQALGRLRP